VGQSVVATQNHAKCDILIIYVYAESIAVLKKECPHFRILIIGRANAGKTTILEKVCGVAQGTKPIILDKHGIKLKANIKPKPKPKPRHMLPSSINQLFNGKSLTYSMSSPAASVTHLTPSVEVSCMVKASPLIDM
jgi:hypothetical protein